MPALKSDILIALDDKYLEAACQFQGFIDQFDITSPRRQYQILFYLEGLLREGEKLNQLTKKNILRNK